MYAKINELISGNHRHNEVYILGSLGPGLLRSDTSPTISNEICRYFMFVVNFQNGIILPLSVDSWLSGSADWLLICWLLGLLGEGSSGSP